MQRTTKKSNETPPPSQAPRAPLKIVIVYDGFADLIRAHEIWSVLVARFKEELHIVSSAWNFTSLHDPCFREQAARQTVDAQMIVLSASGRSELPDHMRSWINIWLPSQKGRRAALVVALDHQTPPSTVGNQFRDHLRRAAEQTGMDFFCNADHCQPPRAAEAGG